MKAEHATFSKDFEDEAAYYLSRASLNYCI